MSDFTDDVLGIDPKDTSTPSGNQLADLSNQLITESSPLRKKMIEQAMFNLDSGEGPAFTAQRNMIERQFSNARNNVIANTPEGGALPAALANLDVSRIQSLSDAYAGVNEANQNRALQLSLGQIGTATSGLSSAASSEAAQAQANAAEKAGLGQAAGKGAAAYFLAS